MSKEIERKWRFLGKIPDSILMPDSGVSLQQAYLPLSPGAVRIRQKGDVFILTIKSEGTLTRDEVEQEIDEGIFKALMRYATGRVISKTRHPIQYGSHLLEVDIFKGEFAGLVYIECEFGSETEAQAFRLPPEWANAEEVTDDSRYTNQQLALKGMPLG
jgi:adenylate cyclase